MRLDLRNNKDFLSGLMFIVIGLGAIFVARDYPVGSTLQMGPGYFPIALGGILFLMGLYVMVQGLVNREKLAASWSLRALVILPLSMIVFGFLMESAGFIPALVVLLFLAAAAGSEFRFRDVLVLTIALTAASTALFIYGLELPYPLLKGF